MIPGFTLDDIHSGEAMVATGRWCVPSLQCGTKQADVTYLPMYYDSYFVR